MKTRIVHRLVGYEPTADRLVFERDLPSGKMNLFKRIAHVAPDDPEAAWSYKLTLDEARGIAGEAGFEVPPGQLEFFLEPFAERVNCG